VDFVVVGFGLGALGVLLGVILRGWLAGRCERAAARADDPAVAAYERANAAECRDAGQAFLAAGGAVILATVGGLAGALNDRSGALLVTTTATVAALGIIFWGYFYRSRHPLPPRPRRQSASATMASPPGAISELAAGASPAALEWATASDKPGAATADLVEHAPVVEADGGPNDAAVDREAPAGDVEGPFPADPAEARDESDDLETDASPDTLDSDIAEAMVPDDGAVENGHIAGDEVGEDEVRVVAFVARGAGGRSAQSAVSDDDAGDER
jgi:hypothetical protein